jgi:hypothetical protein
MANSKLPNNPKPLAGLPYDEFVAKYATLYRKAPKNADNLRPLSSVNEPHEPLLRVSALKDSWFGRVLRAAAEENCPAAFRDLVELWCMHMGVRPPDGVFIRRPGKPGAPHSEETAKIYATWIRLGEPPTRLSETRTRSIWADSEGWRSAFRTDVDHDSEVMPISVPN